MKEHTETNTARYNSARKWLIFWTSFIGIGAVAGGLSMIIDPSGKTLHMDAMLPFFQKLPFADVLFQNFLFSRPSMRPVTAINSMDISRISFAGIRQIHAI